MATADAIQVSDTFERCGRTSRRDNLTAALLGCWTVGGVYLDGWAHNNRGNLETFFTPWHAVLYSGFFCLSAWVVYVARRERRPGFPLWQTLPVGYEWALLGVIVFAAGGVFDTVWHTVFGIEKSVEALLSPPHLVLLMGGSLAVAAPFRAAWFDRDGDARPRLALFLPALLALLSLCLLGSFFFQYLSAFISKAPAAVPQAGRFARSLNDATQINGIASIMITNLIVIAPVVLVLRRWRPPLGTVTLLFGACAALDNALREFVVWPVIVTAVAAGVAVDLLIVGLRVEPCRAGMQRLIAAAASLLLWCGYFLALQLAYGLVWDVQLWLGTTLTATLCTVALSYVVTVPVPTGV